MSFAPMARSPTTRSFRRRLPLPIQVPWSSASAASSGDCAAAPLRCGHPSVRRAIAPAPNSLRIDVIVAILIAIARSDRGQSLEGLVGRRAGSRRAHRLLLTHDLLQALFQVTAHLALHAGAVGPDHIHHEILTQN